MKLRDENKIVISEADRSHAGSYECIANNSLGISTSAIIRVQVLCKCILLIFQDILFDLMLDHHLLLCIVFKIFA